MEQLHHHIHHISNAYILLFFAISYKMKKLQVVFLRQGLQFMIDLVFNFSNFLRVFEHIRFVSKNSVNCTQKAGVHCSRHPKIDDLLYTLWARHVIDEDDSICPMKPIFGDCPVFILPRGVPEVQIDSFFLVVKFFPQIVNANCTRHALIELVLGVPKDERTLSRATLPNQHYREVQELLSHAFKQVSHSTKNRCFQFQYSQALVGIYTIQPLGNITTGHNRY